MSGSGLKLGMYLGEMLLRNYLGDEAPHSPAGEHRASSLEDSDPLFLSSRPSSLDHHSERALGDSARRFIADPQTYLADFNPIQHAPESSPQPAKIALALAENAIELHEKLEELEQVFSELHTLTLEEKSELVSGLMSLSLQYLEFSKVPRKDLDDATYVQDELNDLAAKGFSILSRFSADDSEPALERLQWLFNGYELLALGEIDRAAENFRKVRDIPEAAEVLKKLKNDKLRVANLQILEIWKAYNREGQEAEWNKSTGVIGLVAGYIHSTEDRVYHEWVFEKWGREKGLVEEIEKLLVTGKAVTIQEALQQISESGPEEYRTSADWLAHSSSARHVESEIRGLLVDLGTKIPPDPEAAEALLHKSYDLHVREGLVEFPLHLYTWISSSSKDSRVQQAAESRRQELADAIQGDAGIGYSAEKVLYLAPGIFKEVAYLLPVALAGTATRLRMLAYLEANGITGYQAVALGVGAEVAAEGTALWAINTTRAAATQNVEHSLDPIHLVKSYGADLIMMGGLKGLGRASQTLAPRITRSLGWVTENGWHLSRRGKMFAAGISHLTGMGSLIATNKVNQWLGLREAPMGGPVEALVNDVMFYWEIFVAHRMVDSLSMGKLTRPQKKMHADIQIREQRLLAKDYATRLGFVSSNRNIMVDSLTDAGLRHEGLSLGRWVRLIERGKYAEADRYLENFDLLEGDPWRGRFQGIMNGGERELSALPESAATRKPRLPRANLLVLQRLLGKDNPYGADFFEGKGTYDLSQGEAFVQALNDFSFAEVLEISRKDGQLKIQITDPVSRGSAVIDFKGVLDTTAELKYSPSGLMVRPSEGANLVEAAQLAFNSQESIPNNRMVLNAQSWSTAIPRIQETVKALQELVEERGITISLKTRHHPYVHELESKDSIALQKIRGPLAASADQNFSNRDTEFIMVPGLLEGRRPVSLVPADWGDPTMSPWRFTGAEEKYYRFELVPPKQGQVYLDQKFSAQVLKRVQIPKKYLESVPLGTIFNILPANHTSPVEAQNGMPLKAAQIARDSVDSKGPSEEHGVDQPHGRPDFFPGGPLMIYGTFWGLFRFLGRLLGKKEKDPELLAIPSGQSESKPANGLVRVEQDSVSMIPTVGLSGLLKYFRGDSPLRSIARKFIYEFSMGRIEYPRDRGNSAFDWQGIAEPYRHQIIRDRLLDLRRKRGENHQILRPDVIKQYQQLADSAGIDPLLYIIRTNPQASFQEVEAWLDYFQLDVASQAQLIQETGWKGGVRRLRDFIQMKEVGDHPKDHTAVIEALGDLKVFEAVRILSHLSLSDQFHPKVRLAAGVALARLGKRREAQAFLNSLPVPEDQEHWPDDFKTSYIPIYGPRNLWARTLVQLYFHPGKTLYPGIQKLLEMENFRDELTMILLEHTDWLQRIEGQLEPDHRKFPRIFRTQMWDPRFPIRTRINSAGILIDLGFQSEARAFLKEILGIRKIPISALPKDLTDYDKILGANLLAAAGARRDALALLRDLAGGERKSGEDPHFWIALADAYETLGENGKAQEYSQKLLNDSLEAGLEGVKVLDSVQPQWDADLRRPGEADRIGYRDRLETPTPSLHNTQQNTVVEGAFETLAGKALFDTGGVGSFFLSFEGNKFSTHRFGRWKILTQHKEAGIRYLMLEQTQKGTEAGIPQWIRFRPLDQGDTHQESQEVFIIPGLGGGIHLYKNPAAEYAQGHQGVRAQSIQDRKTFWLKPFTTEADLQQLRGKFAVHLMEIEGFEEITTGIYSVRFKTHGISPLPNESYQHYQFKVSQGEARQLGLIALDHNGKIRFNPSPLKIIVIPDQIPWEPSESAPDSDHWSLSNEESQKIEVVHPNQPRLSSERVRGTSEPFEKGEPLTVVTEEGNGFEMFFPREGFPAHRLIVAKVLKVTSKKIFLQLKDPSQREVFGDIGVVKYQGEHPFHAQDVVHLLEKLAKGGSGKKPEDPFRYISRINTLGVTSQDGSRYELQKISNDDAKHGGDDAFLISVKKLTSRFGFGYRGEGDNIALTFGLFPSTESGIVDRIAFGRGEKEPSHQLTFILTVDEMESMGIKIDEEGNILGADPSQFYFTLTRNQSLSQEASTELQEIKDPQSGALLRKDQRGEIFLDPKTVDQEIILGRSPESFSRRLFSGDSTISRKHIRITPNPETQTFLLTNLSANGTTIYTPGKTPIQLGKDQSVLIKPEDLIRIGNRVIQFREMPAKKLQRTTLEDRELGIGRKITEPDLGAALKNLERPGLHPLEEGKLLLVMPPEQEMMVLGKDWFLVEKFPLTNPGMFAMRSDDKIDTTHVQIIRRPEGKFYLRNISKRGTTFLPSDGDPRELSEMGQRVPIREGDSFLMGTTLVTFKEPKELSWPQERPFVEEMALAGEIQGKAFSGRFTSKIPELQDSIRIFSDAVEPGETVVLGRQSRSESQLQERFFSLPDPVVRPEHLRLEYLEGGNLNLRPLHSDSSDLFLGNLHGTWVEEQGTWIQILPGQEYILGPRQRFALGPIVDGFFHHPIDVEKFDPDNLNIREAPHLKNYIPVNLSDALVYRVGENGKILWAEND